MNLEHQIVNVKRNMPNIVKSVFNIDNDQVYFVE